MTFYYTRPSDSLLASATLSVNTGTEDSAYPKANITNGEPQQPARLTTTAGSWVADLGSARLVDVAAIFHHNLTTGLSGVKLQGHTANSWGAPDVDLTITIPALNADGFPPNPWVDLKTLVPTDANRTKRYWRLLVPTNASVVSIGEWLLGTTRRTLTGILSEKVISNIMYRPSKIHMTDALVRKRYDIGTTVRKLHVDILSTSAEIVLMREWFRDAQGAVKPFLIVPKSDENEAWFVTFVEQDRAFDELFADFNTTSLEFSELSRGLAP
jgi:hypothetical protein